MRKLVSTVYVDGVAYGPDSEVPADVAKRIVNPKAWDGDAPADTSGGDQNGTGLPDTVEELEALIEERNADREEADRIEVTGTGANGRVKKADLVAALKADDAARAAE